MGSRRTLFWKDASAMDGTPFICPLAPDAGIAMLCPKSVGPNTIAIFWIDIAFCASCCMILYSNSIASQIKCQNKNSRHNVLVKMAHEIL